MDLKRLRRDLIEWYRENKRALPWRENRDPYRIWISETMLQQTTTTAVIPYFERFVSLFPTLESLANAPVERVLEAWAGLGYYSRARNLHKSARALHDQGGFPRTFEELIEFPGFGPYTSRSVASLAFGQPVGVVDGNVIRVLSRVYNREWDWWTGQARVEIQSLADDWVRGVPSEEMNQAVMELGRTVCAPKQTSCLLCPIRAHCSAFRAGRPLALPKPKPRREREIWIWEARVEMRKDQVLLWREAETPFLKGHWSLPGRARRVKVKPKTFDYKHSITHHDIYVTLVASAGEEATSPAGEKWVALKEIRQYAPTSLVDKALHHWNDRRRGMQADFPEGGGRARRGGTRARSGGRRR